MKRIMFLCAAVISLAALCATALDLPVREPVGITNTSPATLTLPAFGGNGQLVAFQVADDQSNNTCTVRHILPVSATRAVTNTVVTLTYTTARGAVTNIASPPYVIAGDKLTATFTTASTGTVFFVRTLAK